jgi:DNA-binding LacI/PurR family transcriptional regulator
MAGDLQEIARITGVAVSTVSRALAGRPGVSSAKRDSIVAVAREKGYMPDPAASGLRTGRGSGLAVVTPPKLSGIASMRSYALFGHGRERFGHTRVVVKNETETLEATVRQALSQKCRAIVVHTLKGELSDGTIDELGRRKVPLVVLDGECNWGHHLLIDRSVGTYQCARLLLLNECRHVYVFSNATQQKPDPRLAGIMRGFDSLGTQLKDSQIVPMAAGFAGGYKAMRDLLAAQVVDGVFCYSDDTATGALRALREARALVPEDVQVVGFDNVAYSEYGAVPLTTVAQPMEEIVTAAVELCTAGGELYSGECTSRSFPTRLIVRDSAPVSRHELRARVFESPPAQG